MRFTLLSVLPLAVASPAAQRRAALAPLVTPADGSNVIPDQYIVKFKDGSSAQTVDEATKSLPTGATHIYQSLFNGFAGTFNSSTLESVRRNPNVEYVEQDAMASASSLVNQTDATWGLVRISHREKGGRGYIYDSSAGAGTCVYVIDTGVDDKLADFEGRAHQIKSFATGEETDGNGHGTHVAGTIGSKTYGVAKRTTIYGVKVLANDGNAPYSDVIAGMEFVVDDKQKRRCPRGVVVNMSLGGAFSTAVNQAAANMVKHNIFVAVAAGNSNADSAAVSPASEPTVCTVAATADDDSKAEFSNFGAPIDIWAPGKDITSLWPTSLIPAGINTISGTSMASPHIAGLGAYLYGLYYQVDAQSMCEQIQALSTADIIKGVPQGTVNKLAYNDIWGEGEEIDKASLI